jgi:hypothetical protein
MVIPFRRSVGLPGHQVGCTDGRGRDSNSMKKDGLQPQNHEKFSESFYRRRTVGQNDGWDVGFPLKNVDISNLNIY